MKVSAIMQETEDDSSVKRTMSFIMSPSKFTSSDIMLHLQSRISEEMKSVYQLSINNKLTKK